MMSIEHVHPALALALEKREYTQLTPVQSAVTEPHVAAHDLLVSAQTGSGKTVAFGLASAGTLLGEDPNFGKASAPLALIITPTRELALQVEREMEWLYAETHAQTATCVGGTDARREMRTLKQGVHLVVGTPGRLKDHITRGHLDTSQLRVVVLDEADEMLDMGFREDLEFILEKTPEDKRTLLFSATVPKPIAQLAKRYQRNALRITTQGEEHPHADIDYQALTVAPRDRDRAVVNLLRYHAAPTAIVFCSTRASVAQLADHLNATGFSTVALSGDLNQNQRNHAMDALRDGRASVCVATDVAARGIDLPSLELVIHADVPKGHELLLHRSGRTGRAGRKGTSALIVPFAARNKTERLFRLANIVAKWGNPPSPATIQKREEERFIKHPALTDDIQDAEQPMVNRLLGEYSPQQLAVALLRLNYQNRPAPEELAQGAPEPVASSRVAKREAFKETFKQGEWITLSVGRTLNAEPRWIVPMLCGVGRLSKKQIGSIRVQQHETFVELASECMDAFMAKVEERGTLERNITVSRYPGIPPVARDGSQRDRRGAPPNTGTARRSKKKALVR
jgi:ATP-dependent RNA helicase DeaD